MRRLEQPSVARVASLCGILLSVSCGGAGAPAPSDDSAFASRFLSERAYRRAVLERSIVNPGNGYSALRLTEYATEESGEPTGWDALAEWNPPLRPLVLGSEPDVAPAPLWDNRPIRSAAEWLTLGQRAFDSFPVEID